MTAEAVTNRRDVLRCTEPSRARGWRRMTLYRARGAADAADVINALSLLIAVYYQRTGTNPSLGAELDVSQA